MIAFNRDLVNVSCKKKPVFLSKKLLYNFDTFTHRATIELKGLVSTQGTTSLPKHENIDILLYDNSIV